MEDRVLLKLQVPAQFRRDVKACAARAGVDMCDVLVAGWREDVALSVAAPAAPTMRDVAAEMLRDVAPEGDHAAR